MKDISIKIRLSLGEKNKKWFTNLFNISYITAGQYVFILPAQIKL
jgi:hypothetical protein